MHTGTLAVLLIFGFPIVLVGGIILIWALKITQGGAGMKNERLRAEETRMIQEIYQGLTKMEERIDALETILLDPNRKEQHHGE